MRKTNVFLLIAGTYYTRPFEAENLSRFLNVPGIFLHDCRGSRKEGCLVLGVMMWACQDAVMDQGTEEEQKPSWMMAREGRNIFVVLCCHSLPDHWIRQGWLYMFISLAVSHFFKSLKHKVDVSNIIQSLEDKIYSPVQTISFSQWCWFLVQVLYSSSTKGVFSLFWL